MPAEIDLAWLRDRDALHVFQLQITIQLLSY